MSFLAGLISGASKQYVENIAAEREQEMEMAQLRATKAAAADKRAVDLMSKASFYLTPGDAVGLGLADRNMAALVSTQDIPFFNYVRDYGKDGYENEFVQLVNMKGAGGNLMGTTLENAMENNPFYTSKRNQYRGALVQSARRIYDQEGERFGKEQKTLRRQSILNRIPGYDDFSDADKMYLDGILSEAINLSVDQAKQKNIIPQDTTVARQPDGSVRLESPIQTINGKRITIRDMSDKQINEIYNIVSRGANTYADDKDDFRTGTERVAKKIQAIQEVYNVPAQESINAIIGVTKGIDEGFVQKVPSGIPYISPAVQDRMKVYLDPIFLNAGFGETAEIVQAALPNSFVPKSEGAIRGATALQVAQDDESAYYSRLGRAKGDYSKKYEQLKQLYSTASTLRELIGDGTKTGLAQRLARLQSGIVSQAEQLFATSPEAKQKFDSLYTTFTGAAPQDKGSRAESVVNFLTNELAYNVARSLESETGNARLSQTDVERAAKSLALEGLFVSKENAQAVLTVILKRTEYEMELADIMSSGIIPKMQAATIVQSTYGTQNMLRTNSLTGTQPSDVRAAFTAFMREVRKEANVEPATPLTTNQEFDEPR